MATRYRLLYTARGSEKLVKVELVTGAEMTVHASNYFTFTVRRRTTSMTYGELVGETYSTATRTVSAGEPVPLYDDPRGIMLLDGEALWATIVSTGSPTTPDNATIRLHIQRIVR